MPTCHSSDEDNANSLSCTFLMKNMYITSKKINVYININMVLTQVYLC